MFQTSPLLKIDQFLYFFSVSALFFILYFSYLHSIFRIHREDNRDIASFPTLRVCVYVCGHDDKVPIVTQPELHFFREERGSGTNSLWARNLHRRLCHESAIRPFRRLL